MAAAAAVNSNEGLRPFHDVRDALSAMRKCDLRLAPSRGRSGSSLIEMNGVVSRGLIVLLVWVTRQSVSQSLIPSMEGGQAANLPT